MRWEVIKDYPNYSISDTGIVKRNVYTRIDKIGRKTVVKEMILKQYTDKDGYLRVALSKNKKIHLIPVHRLVAITYIPNKCNLPSVNHKNEIKIDNNVDNLEWCTVSYNNNYGSRQDRVRKTSGKKVMGIKGNRVLLFQSASQASIYITDKKIPIYLNVQMVNLNKYMVIYGGGHNEYNSRKINLPIRNKR